MNTNYEVDPKTPVESIVATKIPNKRIIAGGVLIPIGALDVVTDYIIYYIMYYIVK